MGEIVIDMDTLNNMRMFEQITRIKPIDCISDETRIVFVVPAKKLSQAIGKNAANVKKIREIVKKNVDIIEFSDDPEKFVRNIFYRFHVNRVEFVNTEKGLTVYVYVRPDEKGRAIGRSGSNLRMAERILQRHYEVSEVYIATSSMKD